MRRYASLDFLRGFAIWMMLLLHVIMRVYDRSWINSSTLMAKRPIFDTLVLVLSAFFGGWAGFFLLLSAIGNTISMQKAKRKGYTAKQILVKQITIGILLLFFAFLTESVTGYHGMLGELALGKSVSASLLLRSYHMETVHTIAYAIIVNGIIHYLLSRKDGYTKEKRNIIIYACLIVLVIALTPLAWKVPNLFYPNFINNKRPSLDSNFSEYFFKFLFLPLAGNPEPLFPYLSLSFLGSIFGIMLARREKPSVKFAKNGIIGGLITTFVGLISTIIFISNGSQDFIQLFDQAWNIPVLNAWFPWFLFTQGIQIMALFLTFRLVEYRGRAKIFAQRTTYFRRHGFVALSIYNWQFLDVIPRWIMYAFGLDAIHEKVGGYWTIFIIIVNFALWHFVLLGWEKIKYKGSLEWIINIIAAGISSLKRKTNYEIANKTEEEKKKRAWHDPVRLDPQASFYDVEWINLREEQKIDYQNHEESKVSLTLSIVGLFIFPLAIIALIVAYQNKKQVGTNQINITALILGTTGLVIHISVIATALIVPFSALGITL